MFTVNFNMELTTIKLLAKNNGYSITLIEKHLRKKSQNQVYHQIFISNIDPANVIYRKMNYLGSASGKIASKHLARFL